MLGPSALSKLLFTFFITKGVKYPISTYFYFDIGRVEGLATAAVPVEATKSFITMRRWVEYELLVLQFNVVLSGNKVRQFLCNIL